MRTTVKGARRRRDFFFAELIDIWKEKSEYFLTVAKNRAPPPSAQRAVVVLLRAARCFGRFWNLANVHDNIVVIIGKV